MSVDTPQSEHRFASDGGSKANDASGANCRGVPLDMSRIRPEFLDSEGFDSFTADALLRQEPNEEEDEEEDEGDGREDADDDDKDDGYSE